MLAECRSVQITSYLPTPPFYFSEWEKYPAVSAPVSKPYTHDRKHALGMTVNKDEESNFHWYLITLMHNCKNKNNSNSLLPVTAVTCVIP